MNATSAHVVELDDNELAVLVQVVGRRNRSRFANERPGSDTARRSLRDRRLILREAGAIHLPLPLAGILVALTSPTVAVTISFDEPSTSAIGGVRDNFAGLAVRTERQWRLWSAPASELLDELRALVQHRGPVNVRVTRQIAPGRVEGVEVDARALRDDPAELAAFIAEATNPKNGPSGAAD